MGEYFYSEKDRILFFIPSEQRDLSDSVSEIVKMFTENAIKVADATNESIEKVKTFFVINSRRFKDRRIFFVETENIPKNAFVVSNNRGMLDFLSN